MNWREIEWTPSPKKLRNFGLIGGVLLGLIGSGRTFAAGASAAWLSFLLAASLFVLAGFAPRWLRPIWIGVTLVSFPLGVGVFWILSLVLYFGIVTPLGAWRRFRGADPLHLQRLDTTSYWQKKTMPKDASSYFRQY